MSRERLADIVVCSDGRYDEKTRELAIAPLSVPSALVVATIGAIASYHLSDEELWRDIQRGIAHYFR